MRTPNRSLGFLLGSFLLATTPLLAAPWLTESFEGSGTAGWDQNGWYTTGSRGMATITGITPPPGGGSKVLRQSWDAAVQAVTWSPDWLVHVFPAGTTDEGDVFEIEYYLMYDPNFVFHQGGSIMKSVLIRSDNGTSIYINSHHVGPVTVANPFITDWDHMTSNMNGNNYTMPNGQWVHFRWQIKIATEDLGTPKNGYIHGWVNGVQRWNYNNMWTNKGGKFVDFNLNSTFNDTLWGPNQHRYWDQIKVGPANSTSEYWVDDSFEAGDPDGWDDAWNHTGSPRVGANTVAASAAGGAPTGGGSHVYEQSWQNTTYPDWLRYFPDQPIADGQVIVLDYYSKYHANFDPGEQDIVKSIIMQSTSHTDDRIYINSHHFGSVGIQLQGLGSGVSWDEMHRHSNMGGGTYVMPHGQWVHYRWEIKLAGKNGPLNGTGYIHGWINGTQRWNHNNLSTHGSGSINQIMLNTTINGAVTPTGPNQKRWWDLFKIGPGGGSTPPPPPPTTYSLTVTNGSGDGSYTPGTSVNIAADPAPGGQQFSQWTGNTAGVANVNSANTTITMPASNVNLTANYVPSVQYLLNDSFENAPSAAGRLDGWQSAWGETGDAGTFNSGLQTIVAATPSGGGNQVLRQSWHPTVTSGWAPEWLTYSFNNQVNEGDIIEMEFYLKYDANFNFGSAQPTLKGIRLWNAAHNSLEWDWNTHHQGASSFQMVEINDQVENWYAANTNGGDYNFPNGQWVHFVWQIKRATEGQASKNGFVRGWVNGTLRWQYENIWTCATGSNMSSIELNATFNNPNLNANNNRYWDLFKMRIIPGGATPPPPPPPPSTGSNAQWPMNGSAVDSSGNNHNGTVNGATYVAGRNGQALSFDGINDSVDVANPNTFNFGTANFSIAAWIKRSNVDKKGWILNKCGNWSSACKEFFIEGNDKLAFGSFETTQLESNASINDTNWHHVAVTFNDSTNLVSLYVDGVFDKSSTQALIADNASHVVKMGAMNGQADFYSGLLDDVHVYNHALSLAEIQTLAQATPPPVNNAPVLAAIGNRTVAENALLTFTISGTDPNSGQTLTYSASNLPAGASFNANTRTFSWTPSYTQSGSYPNVTFTVTDNGSPVMNDSEQITITVTNTNQAPILASIGPKAVAENALLTFTISGTDADSGQTLTYSATNLPTGASFNANTRTFSWTPSNTQSGTYNITFRVTDNGSPTANDSEVVTITVTNTNQAPVLAAIGDKSVQENISISFVISATDADNGQTLTYSASGLPGDAIFNPSTRRFTWTPTPSEVGSHDVTFTVTDNGSPVLIDSEVITITVNAAPVVPPPPPPPDDNDPPPTQTDVPFKNVLNLAENSSLEIKCDRNVRIVSRSGDLVRELTCGGTTTDWDGRNLDGQTISAGLYILLEEQKKNRKVVVIK